MHENENECVCGVVLLNMSGNVNAVLVHWSGSDSPARFLIASKWRARMSLNPLRRVSRSLALVAR